METMKVKMIAQGKEIFGEVYFEEGNMIFLHDNGKIVYEGIELTHINENYQSDHIVTQTMEKYVARRITS